uniref:N(4)(BetaNacetylglucosaminyl)Lasparaginase putative n=1 Tax=Albugo laibachii Nc14 TaxID=890382 RepID=F0WN46_9STRA|nr:N(4)(BetaNacetylglucosaminyl)Lasparaginase putative [Albugo laibachii Nc14]|eukprot:CCA22735.1 N(4)(BetaNacetylglucosaminyl)Lasparaginase putative [Albugo laibachii Nc14]
MIRENRVIPMRTTFSIFFLLALAGYIVSVKSIAVMNTWSFTAATKAAFDVLATSGHHAANVNNVLDAIVAGCNRCEIDQCDYTVGYGASPDTNGETTLDAMILDGTYKQMGAVGQLRRVKAAIKVARAVLHHSAHSILVGDGALAFAKMMGFQEESLKTSYSKKVYRDWQHAHCQPNYFRNVYNQTSSCPPYHPILHDKSVPSHSAEDTASQSLVMESNHDTIGMVVLDSHGNMGAGTSSNGANHKIAGRVGDGTIPGAGAYVDSKVGGAAATGDGDLMMRFLPSFQAVQHMASGLHVSRVFCMQHHNEAVL